MSDRRWLKLAILVPIFFTATLFAQDSNGWHDSSPHKVQFVTVDKDVKLEVLDWGGTGRPVVLLTGLGNTAHVFDDFAPKLTSQYHVYGITRRGFGASSIPPSGYSADRFGDDVLAVLDALKLDHPVLVGHSVGGEELSSVATRYPERVAGLVYLDAAYFYAYYDSKRGDFTMDRLELIRKLQQLQPEVTPSDLKTVQQLLQQDLPSFEKDLRDEEGLVQAESKLPPSPPRRADRTSFSAYHAWQMKAWGWAFPESELRQDFESNPDGSVGKALVHAEAQAIKAGLQEYTDIKVPALAIYVLPPESPDNDPAARALRDRVVADTMAQASAFEAGVPSARVVRLPNAEHYVFLSNEADVLREMRAFLKDTRRWSRRRRSRTTTRPCSPSLTSAVPCRVSRALVRRR